VTSVKFHQVFDVRSYVYRADLVEHRLVTDRQTDIQTDVRPDRQTNTRPQHRGSIASHGKGEIPLRYQVADRFELGSKLVVGLQRAEIWPII